MNPDEIRRIVSEELDTALAPIRESIARLGQPHSRDAHEQEALEAGKRAAHRAALQQRLQPTEDQNQDEPETPPQTEPEPQRKPQRRRPPMLVVPTCERCGRDMVRDDDGLRCPSLDCA